jgi:uncharacterized protein YndB with AHSA1/START domain
MSDWTRFTKRVAINAKPDAIYRAWATCHGLESWLLRGAECSKVAGGGRDKQDYFMPGDRYLWAWHGWGDEANLRGEILETNGTDRLKFTFHDPMVVTIAILREHETSLVELRQENIPDDDQGRSTYFVGCGEGWTFYLANLKSTLEGGLDLRNRDPRLERVINS